jgi:bifunctional DNA-binding transcriptional regulator/antitoxin component of YhaV-PrlF toxin-antitoxin module
VKTDGKVTISAEYREALGLTQGSELMIVLENGELRLLTPTQAIRKAQGIVRHYIPEGRSLADELIAERRTEAKRE